MVHRQTNHAVGHLVGIWKIFRSRTFQSSICRELTDERVEITATENISIFHLEIKFVPGHAIFFCINKNREITVIVFYTRHVIKESNTIYIAKSFTVFDSYLLACCYSIIYLAEIEESVCCTHLIYLGINTGANNCYFTCKAKVFEIVNTLLGLFVMHHHCTTFYGIIDLCRME